MTEPTTTRPKRTPEEQVLLDDLAKLKGRELTEREANNAIAQAELIGEL